MEIFAFIGLMVCVLGLARNNLVLMEKMHVYREVLRRCEEDAKAGRRWRWRIEEFESITYNRMMLEFWTPVPAFYCLCKFLAPAEERK